MTTLEPKPSILKALIPLAFAIIGVALIGAGLSSWWKTRTTEPSHKGAHSSSISIEEGEILPDLTYWTEAGAQVTISTALKSHKIILLNFWASWCQACLIEMPSLSKTRSELAPLGFEVFAINLDENPAEGIAKTRSKIEIPFPIWIDKNGDHSEKMDIHAIPVSLVINQDRKILWAVYGDHEWNDASSLSRLRTYLQEAKGS